MNIWDTLATKGDKVVVRLKSLSHNQIELRQKMVNKIIMTDSLISKDSLKVYFSNRYQETP